MKVILFICILCIFLFFYSVQEGFENQCEPLTILRNLKDTDSYANAPLYTVVDDLKRKISDENKTISEFEADQSTDVNLKQFYITTHRNTRTFYERQKSIITELYSTGRVKESNTIGEAIIIEEAYLANINATNTCTTIGTTASTSTPAAPAPAPASAPAPSPGISPAPVVPPPTLNPPASGPSPQYTAAAIKYGDGLNPYNPSSNSFAYAYAKYAYSDSITVLNVYMDFSGKPHEKDWAILMVKQTVAPITGATKIKDAVIHSLSWLNTIPLTSTTIKTDNIITLIDTEPIYRKNGNIGWTSSDPLDYIVYKLQLSYVALEAQRLAFKKISGTSEPFTRFINYADNLKKRLYRQYDLNQPNNRNFSANTTLDQAKYRNNQHKLIELTI